MVEQLCMVNFNVLFQAGNASAGDEDEEYEETEEDDRDKFRDQLCSIGAFGRLVSQHSVPLLSR